MDDLPESIDLETVRRDKPVEYAGRVQKLGFREGLLVAGGLIVILTGAGVVAIGPAVPQPSASPSSVAAALTPPTSAASPSPSLRPSPTVEPTPAVTPGGSCVRLSRSSGQPYVTLVTADSQKTTGMQFPDAAWSPTEPGTDAVTDGMPVDMPLAQPFTILSVGLAACALEWRLTVDGSVIQAQSNPGMDPGYAQQGYFRFITPASLAPVVLLRLDLHFEYGWTTSSWLLTFDPAPIPTAIVVAGSDFVDALPGCNFSIALANGLSRSEGCGVSGPDFTGLQRIYVAPSTVLALRVPHASLDSPDVIACGHLTGTPPLYSDDPTCDVAVYGSSTEDYAFTAPSGIGVWLVGLYACATRDIGKVCGTWYVRVDTRRSGATPTPLATDPGGVVP